MEALIATGLWSGKHDAAMRVEADVDLGRLDGVDSTTTVNTYSY
jgi:hypothetical protein